ncbi:TIGR01841 family phasin [Novosphingobium piscinae]|uniref:TIGR01841 family phasin n=1 Tax=Novosphingobium piscinae TaxID=1507448 RepID=A0A7X1FZQ3_9SPHN|nr:phasin family protein [Novosphingobium piscinae]MBC2669966.1 TIGR01841 family phasin [Novosphingobium piscinae]
MAAETDTPLPATPAAPSGQAPVVTEAAPKAPAAVATPAIEAPAAAKPAAPVAAAKPAVAAEVKAPAPATAAQPKVVKTKAAKAKPAKIKPAAIAVPKAPVVKAPVVKAPVVKAPVVPAPVVKAPVAKAPTAKRPRKPVAVARVAAPKPITKPVTVKTPTPAKAAPVSRPLPKLKDQTMATQAFDFVAPFKTVFADLQEKAKTAYEKSTVTLTEANDFAKGNVEAVVESGKILASGLQELGTSALTDSRAAFETMTAEIKTLASAKSPTEFFQLQTALLRKHFDTAVAQTSKSTEAMLKLANDSIAPLSSRVTIAVEKVSKVA